MMTMSSLLRSRSSLSRRLAAWSATVLMISAALAATPPAPQAFDIPAGEGEPALTAFARQAKVEVIYSIDKVEGVKTNAVKGELAPRAALERLVAGTGLIVLEDEKTGALTVTTPEPASAPKSAAAEATENRLVKLENVEVRADRIDGLNNRGLLQAGENAPLYHEVVSRQDIERLGISSLEELFRYIPQTSNATTSLQAPASNSNTTGGLINKPSTIGLRGFDSSQTVVLINGRALPRSGLGGDGGADIGRIPIAAIERVEVLPYSGSAIYGAGAIGGAINIILRKDYSGSDLTTYVGTSTGGGATEYRVTYLEGRSFNRGKTNLTLTLSYQHRDALRANQRDYLDEALARYGPGSTAVNAQGQSIFEQLILPAFAGSPATILVSNPPGAAVDDLGIPGAAGVRYAAIPAGTTAAQSLALTPASFTATAGKAVLSPRYSRSILYEPIDAYSLNAQVGHEFIKDKLDGYGEFTVGYTRKDYSMPQQIVFYLDADDPLNPFRTDVTPGFVGRPVTILVDTPDLPDPTVLSQNQSARAVLGLKGQFSERWGWSVDGVVDYAHNTLDSSNPPDNLDSLIKLTPYSDPGPAAPAEVRRAVYPILEDHSQSPLSAEDVRRYFEAHRLSSSNSVQYEANARVLGELVSLPAGPLRTSVAGKYQDWDFNGGQLMTGSDAWSQLVNNGPVPENTSPSGGSRKIWMGVAELSVPVIGRAWQPIPVESFEIQASAAYERDQSEAHDPDRGTLTDRQSANSRVLAGKLQVTPDVALRGSFSEGFFPPEWGAFSMPTSTFMLPGFFADPKRGNTMQFTPMMTITQGGNTALKPETAKSQNAGLILTPRFLPGLTLSVDYWKIAKKDAIVSTSFTDIIANPDAFGFLITREEPTPAEAAIGWLGRITAVDARAINASRTTTEGFDLQARYSLPTASAGTFDFMGGASFTNFFLLQTTPVAPIINTSGGSGPIRWRGNASLTWTKNRWSTTVTGRYVGQRSTTTTAPSPSYPGAFALDGDHIPSYIHWDLQIGYEIPYQPGGSGVKAWLHGTKFTLGALNVLNDKPAFVSDGYSFYNSYDDPRQRYVYLQVRKSF